MPVVWSDETGVLQVRKKGKEKFDRSRSDYKNGRASKKDTSQDWRKKNAYTA